MKLWILNERQCCALKIRTTRTSILQLRRVYPLYPQRLQRECYAEMPQRNANKKGILMPLF